MSTGGTTIRATPACGVRPGRAPLGDRAGRLGALLFLLLTFLRAGVAPPCDAHHHPDARQETAAGPHARHASHDGGGHDDSLRCCDCMGACHPTTAVGIANGEAATVVANVLLLAHEPVSRGHAAAPPTSRTYLLPFATAPPIGEV